MTSASSSNRWPIGGRRRRKPEERSAPCLLKIKRYIRIVTIWRLPFVSFLSHHHFYPLSQIQSYARLFFVLLPLPLLSIALTGFQTAISVTRPVCGYYKALFIFFSWNKRIYTFQRNRRYSLFLSLPYVDCYSCIHHNPVFFVTSDILQHSLLYNLLSSASPHSSWLLSFRRYVIALSL